MTANTHHLDVKCKYFAIKHSLLVTSTVLTNLRTTLFLSKGFSYCLKSTLYNSFLNQLVPICIHTHVIHSVFMTFYEICVETEFYSFILFSWSLIMSFSSSIFFLSFFLILHLNNIHGVNVFLKLVHPIDSKMSGVKL